MLMPTSITSDPLKVEAPAAATKGPSGEECAKCSGDCTTSAMGMGGGCIVEILSFTLSLAVQWGDSHNGGAAGDPSGA
jgi:hypothetical protein